MLQITLKAARVNSGMRIEEAAECLGISKEVLRNYERGRTIVPAYIVKKASKVYDVPEQNFRVQ